jgi:hypothetical protein
LKKRYLELVALFGSCAGLLAFTSLVFLATASPAQAACGSLPSSLGTATLSVSVPSNGNYRVWVRELAPSTSTGGFYLQMADAGDCQITMGNAQVVANTWTWVDYQNANTGSPVNVTLTSGSHQVILAALNSGLELDKIELLSDTSCTPTGDGTNCTQAAVSSPTPSSNPTSPTPTPTAIPVSTGGGGSGGSGGSTPIVSGQISIAPTNLPSDVTSVQYLVDGKPVASGSINTADLSDGKHTIEVKATTAGGKTIVQTSTINVKNHKTPEQQFVAAVQSHRIYVGLLAVLIILAPIVWFANYRFNLIEKLRQRVSPSPASVPSYAAPTATTSPTLSPTDSTPTGPVVYPDNFPKDE